MAPPLRIARDVRDALRDRRPVVALESSIVAHGFPRPDNLALGREMLAAVRAGGAVPAQVAVLDGAVKVGLDEGDLERLANEDAAKCSARDLAHAVVDGTLGATTVAATARVAAIAGIAVFATGGIGGVHPGTFDVSADLVELSRSPVAVVSSGAKSILDLGTTLEALETLGVPVVGYGTDRFPAFHARDSGFALERRVDDPTELARLMATHWSISPGVGLLLCHAPPASVAMDLAELEAIRALALGEATRAGVRGQALTPFLLAAMNRLSDGRTLAVNRALAIANAAAGAAIAAAHAALVD